MGSDETIARRIHDNASLDYRGGNSSPDLVPVVGLEPTTSLPRGKGVLPVRTIRDGRFRYTDRYQYTEARYTSLLHRFPPITGGSTGFSAGTR